MSTTTTSTAAGDLDRVRASLEAVIDQGLDLADRIAAAVQPVVGRGSPHKSDLAVVEPLVRPVLADLDQPIQGAGFVVAVDLLADARWWLEWFTRESSGRVSRLATQSDPDSVGFFDYEPLPWYTVPRRTGRRHITGPYVDYLCTEEYTLTFSSPVFAGDAFAGIAGADIPVRHVEKQLLPALGSASSRLVVVNDHGRILSSNSGRHVCGDLLYPEDRASERAAVSLDTVPLTIIDLGD